MHTEGLRLNYRVYASLRRQCHFLRVSLFLIVLFCLHTSQLITQSSVYNDWRRRHISNTNSYSILGRGKQLFENFLPVQAYEKEFAEFPFPVESIIPWLIAFFFNVFIIASLNGEEYWSGWSRFSVYKYHDVWTRYRGCPINTQTSTKCTAELQRDFYKGINIINGLNL